MMEPSTGPDTVPVQGQVSTQQHACTAVIEELVAHTLDSAWDDDA
jgi:hypothetical protein